MSYEFLLLKNKEFAKAFNQLLNCIDDVYEKLAAEGIVINKSVDKNFAEYGFYIKSRDKAHTLFFGFWLSLWESTGQPLCICFDWINESDSKLEKFEAFINSNSKLFSGYLNFEEYPVAIFQEEYLIKANSADFSQLIRDLANSILLDYVRK